MSNVRSGKGNHHICEKCGKDFIAGPTAKICPSCKDVTGQVVGKWTVIEKAPSRGRYDYFLCQCECGTKKEVSGDALRSGKSTSCGCISRSKALDRYEKYRSEFISKKFGELEVIGIGKKKNGKYLLKCKCSCGKIVEYLPRKLITGEVVSCGHKKIAAASSLSECGTNPAAIASKKVGKRNTSGAVGVSYNKSRGLWEAEIMFKNTRYRLGRFANKEDAINARKDAEKELHGEFLDWYKENYPDNWERLCKKQTDVGTGSEE